MVSPAPGRPARVHEPRTGNGTGIPEAQQLPAPCTTRTSSSYSAILKSSSIAGGAQAITLGCTIVRGKIAALFLGPEGVGLISVYDSLLGVMGTLTSLGVAQSAVRQVAERNGNVDTARLAATVLVLRRLSWLTGSLGVIATAAVAWPLGMWTFGSADRTVALVALGIALLPGALSNGQSALLQGLRRIPDLARAQALSSLLSLAATAALYGFLGDRGIVPVFLVAATVNLVCSWWYARQVTLPDIQLGSTATWTEAARLVKLGLAFTVAGLSTSVAGWILRGWILHDLGFAANGFYHAAWTVSAVFAGFILASMGADFYPRLAAASRDHAKLNRLVNEQTEFGVLLALPGLLATMIFSRWAILMLYSERFEPAAALLPWLVLGVFGRVVSWPLGFIQPATGAVSWFAATELLTGGLHLFLAWCGLRWFGLVGAAVAFSILYVCYTAQMLYVARHLTGFRWTPSALRVLRTAGLAIVVALMLAHWASPIVAAVLGIAITVAAALHCARHICLRLEPRHPIVEQIRRLPIIGPLLD